MHAGRSGVLTFNGLRPRTPAKRRPSRPRDTYRSRVYAAEVEVLGCPGPKPDLPELTDVVAFVREVELHPWWQSGPVLKRRPVRVTSGSGARRAMADSRDGRIIMPRWSRSRPVVIHELAHLLTPEDRAGHGTEWIDLYLTGLRDVLGGDLAVDLAKALSARNVPGVKLPGYYSSGS